MEENSGKEQVKEEITKILEFALVIIFSIVCIVAFSSLIGGKL